MKLLYVQMYDKNGSYKIDKCPLCNKNNVELAQSGFEDDDDMFSSVHCSNCNVWFYTNEYNECFYFNKVIGNFNISYHLRFDKTRVSQTSPYKMIILIPFILPCDLTTKQLQTILLLQ